MTDETLSKMVNEVTGSFVVSYHTQDRRDVTMDFTPLLFKRISIVTVLKAHLRDKLGDTNISIPRNLEVVSTRSYMDELSVELKSDCEAPRTILRLLNSFAEELIEGEYHNPFFIGDQFKVMSPIVKWHQPLPNMSGRFGHFANDTKFGSTFPELSDLELQKDRSRVSQGGV